MGNRKRKTVLVTGSAGFIGFHTSKRLLDAGWRVIGFDCMSDYYDVNLKQRRESILLQNEFYVSNHEHLENSGALKQVFRTERPDVVIHLAAQAGVRYSIENPRTYLESNIVGTFELLEAARVYPPEHILIASTSSVYGANNEMPHRETDKADNQISFYAATKKSTESMAHSYSHIHKLPVTMFRFFTVYGPWGRPDMALFKFTKAMLENKEIDVYNNGQMRRDFTYIDDLVTGIVLLINANPNHEIGTDKLVSRNESKSPVSPFRVVNIGNSTSEKLMDYINALEEVLGFKAKKKYLPMQKGDVEATWADSQLIETLTGYRPATDISTGVKRFVDWYKYYYRI
jgi:UDP-glucuronate 4-epimerase